jgi:hypothetical protein
MDNPTFRDPSRGPGLSDLTLPAFIAAGLVVLSVLVDILSGSGLIMTP